MISIQKLYGDAWIQTEDYISDRCKETLTNYVIQTFKGITAHLESVDLCLFGSYDDLTQAIIKICPTCHKLKTLYFNPYYSFFKSKNSTKLFEKCDNLRILHLGIMESNVFPSNYQIRSPDHFPGVRPLKNLESLSFGFTNQMIELNVEYDDSYFNHNPIFKEFHLLDKIRHMMFQSVVENKQLKELHLFGFNCLNEQSMAMIAENLSLTKFSLTEFFTFDSLWDREYSQEARKRAPAITKLLPALKEVRSLKWGLALSGDELSGIAETCTELETLSIQVKHSNESITPTLN